MQVCSVNIFLFVMICFAYTITDLLLRYFLVQPDYDLSMFQDGFFDGELVTGRRGLVPSNFLEKVAGKICHDKQPTLTCEKTLSQ